jgi:hypothetical protein
VGAAHGHLQPALIAEPDLGAEHRAHGLAGGELAAVDLPQDVIERFQRSGHLEVRELAAQAIPQRGGGWRAHQTATSTSTAAWSTGWAVCAGAYGASNWSTRAA